MHAASLGYRQGIGDTVASPRWRACSVYCTSGSIRLRGAGSGSRGAGRLPRRLGSTPVSCGMPRIALAVALWGMQHAGRTEYNSHPACAYAGLREYQDRVSLLRLI